MLGSSFFHCCAYKIQLPTNFLIFLDSHCPLLFINVPRETTSNMLIESLLFWFALSFIQLQRVICCVLCLVFFVIFLSQFFSMVFYVAFIWLCFLLQIIFLVATPQFQSFKHFCQFLIIIKATLNFLNIKLFVSLDHGVLCMSSSLHRCPLANANFFSFQASHVCILLSYFLYALCSLL